jgi:hypothetical protein
VVESRSFANEERKLSVEAQTTAETGDSTAHQDLRRMPQTIDQSVVVVVVHHTIK